MWLAAATRLPWLQKEIQLKTCSLWPELPEGSQRAAERGDGQASVQLQPRECSFSCRASIGTCC